MRSRQRPLMWLLRTLLFSPQSSNAVHRFDAVGFIAPMCRKLWPFTLLSLNGYPLRHEESSAAIRRESVGSMPYLCRIPNEGRLPVPRRSYIVFWARMAHDWIRVGTARGGQEISTPKPPHSIPCMMHVEDTTTRLQNRCRGVRSMW